MEREFDKKVKNECNECKLKVHNVKNKICILEERPNRFPEDFETEAYEKKSDFVDCIIQCRNETEMPQDYQTENINEMKNIIEDLKSTLVENPLHNQINKLK
ncbi:hypothetical protein NUSPORA_00332 [Nucleospora cyclopteri]